MVVRSHTRPDSDAPAQPAFWPLMTSLRLPDSGYAAVRALRTAAGWFLMTSM